MKPIKWLTSAAREVILMAYDTQKTLRKALGNGQSTGCRCRASGCCAGKRGDLGCSGCKCK